MTIYFVTRHSGALHWAALSNLKFDVHVEHLHDMDALHAHDVVIGTLPINMVYALNQKNIRYIHLSLQIPPELRGIELDASQLEACQATLEEFMVQKIE